MSTSRILLAKSTRPSCAGVFPRARLFKRIDKARSRPVIWIAGPPGAGKTVLVASYLEKRKLASLWYEIDETDADVASFFYHLEVAVAARARGKPPHLPRLTPQHVAALSTFTRRYFEQLYAHLGKGFVVVFDGYQGLGPQSPLQEVISIALTIVPPGGSVILISRTEPPPPMTRLRANRALEVIGWRDLKLTEKESAAIAAQRGLALDTVRLHKLYEKTEGWAAGLILLLEQAAEGLWPTTEDLSSPQLIFDYLAGEIFEKTDSTTREVLLTTASLPHMTAEMAQILSGRPDAAECLDHLYRNNYFVALKQSTPEPVYEYHPMMREFITARANAMLPRERRQSLQRRSAELLQAQGLVAEAVALARASADWERIADIIRHHARAMLDSGRSETLAQWVESLPKAFQDQHPWTLYWIGVARTAASPRESRRAHERAFELFSVQQSPDLRGLLLTCSGAMDAILYELDDFSLLDRWIELMDRLLHDHSELVSGPLEARIACSLFTSMVLRQPHHPQIEYWAERAYRTSAAQADVNVRISVETRIALGVAYGGHFPNAWSIIEGVRDLAKSHLASGQSRTLLRLVEATYYMLTAQREECYAAVRAGIDLERAEGINVLSRQLLAYGAGGALAAGDLAAAQAFLKEAEALSGVPARFDLCLHHLFSTWLAMRRHDTVRAYQQQKLALQMAVEVGCPVFEVLCRIASAHVLYEGGEQRAAWLQFQQIYDTARRIRNHFLEYTGLLSYAYVALDSGRRPHSGMRALRQALAVGKPRNYLSFPLWRPEMLARLCGLALERGVEQDFVQKLIDARALELDAASSALLQWPWPLRVYTLGRFGVMKEGAWISFSGKAQRRPLDLLKVIVARGGREVSEERVIEALWPRIDGDSAHRSFTITLHRLRKLLGIERAVQLSDGKLSLDGRLVWVDAWAFEQATVRIQRMLHSELGTASLDRSALAELSAKLVDHYAGPFLGSEPEQAWMLPLRDRLRQRFMRSVADVARHWETAGSAQLSIDLLERAIELDHASEGIYRFLMECYVRLGRRAEAVDTYSRCRRMLAAALNVAPSRETTALFETLTQAP